MAARDKHGEIVAEGEEVIIRGRVTKLALLGDSGEIHRVAIQTIETNHVGAASVIYLESQQVEIAKD